MTEDIQFGLKNGFDWNYLGALLANKEATVQAAFLKSFLTEMLTWETRWQVESQLSAVNLHLTPKERELINIISYEEEKI